MEIKNKSLMNVALKMRNKISAAEGAVRFQNVHNADNEILIEGKESVLAFEGTEGYIRFGKVIIKGEGDTLKVGNNSTLINGCSIRLIGNNNSVMIGENCRLDGFSIYVLGSGNHIVIGNEVSTAHTSFHIETDNNSITVGNGTTFHGRDNGLIELALDEGTSISIGNDCMISNDVCFRSSDSHSILNEKGVRINPAKDIVINDHIWIGMRAMILKGTTIKNNCMIGAGSICNKDYEKENCLIAGNPAKIVKENVNWSRDRL